MHYKYYLKNVCSQSVDFDIDDDHLIHNVQFIGGCNGNLKAIGILTEGMKAEKVSEMLLGNTCGFRPTSCADQFAKAINHALTK